jgi:polyhydroxybutyrate depolymerase
MSYRLACEMADTFASVASVAGTLGVPPDTCTPKRPVPLMHVHGTSDVIVPYDGGGIGGNRSVDVSVGAFRAKNACASSGAPAYSKGDVSCTQWGGCKDDADVKLCTVQNGAHAWPGGVGVPYAGTKDLDATNAIVDFFEAHGLK